MGGVSPMWTKAKDDLVTAAAAVQQEWTCWTAATEAKAVITTTTAAGTTFPHNTVNFAPESSEAFLR